MNRQLGKIKFEKVRKFICRGTKVTIKHEKVKATVKRSVNQLRKKKRFPRTTNIRICKTIPRSADCKTMVLINDIRETLIQKDSAKKPTVDGYIRKINEHINHSYKDVKINFIMKSNTELVGSHRNNNGRKDELKVSDYMKEIVTGALHQWISRIGKAESKNRMCQKIVTQL